MERITLELKEMRAHLDGRKDRVRYTKPNMRLNISKQ